MKDNEHTRISATYENVGSRDWMPGWAHGLRIDEVKPTFDIFALGKLLWSMLSGKQILQLWYYNREQFNVEILFPDSSHIKHANRIFEKCIVENEENCLPDATALLDEIDSTLTIIDLNADPIGKDIKRRCKVCAIGEYELVADHRDRNAVRNFGFNAGGDRKFMIFTCNHCGHVQFFSYKDPPPKAWREAYN